MESKDAYYKLMKGGQKATFIRFKDLQEASKPVPLNNLLTMLVTNKIGRKGFYVNKEIAHKLIRMME